MQYIVEFKHFARLLNENRWKSTILFTFIMFTTFALTDLVLLKYTYSSLGVIFIAGPVIYAINDYYLTYSRRVDLNGISSIKMGFINWGKSAGLYLLISIEVFLWSLLFIIPGVIKLLSYSQSFYILIDNPDVSVKEALRTSSKMMRGFKNDLFLLNLSFIGWYVLGILALGIPLFYVVPYHLTTKAVFYEHVKLNYHNRCLNKHI